MSEVTATPAIDRHKALAQALIGGTPTSKALSAATPAANPTPSRSRRSRSVYDSEILAHQQLLNQSASRLAEYEWPPFGHQTGNRRKTIDDEDNLWMVQEQVGNFLNITSFKRKYPDVDRRRIDGQEADWLRDQGHVIESQMSLGLTAIRARDVHRLMQRDYPEKYDEFLDELANREKKEFMNEQKRYAQYLKRKAEDTSNLSKKIYENSDKTFYKPAKLSETALIEAKKFSNVLQKRRKYVFSSYYDENTNIIQYPKDKKFKMVDPELTRPDPHYPCQVMPGQYSSYYVKFTPDQLKYLPLQQVAKPGMRKEYKLRALVNNPNYRIETKKAPCNADDLENMKDHVEISESEDEILVEESEDEILLDGELMAEDNAGRESGLARDSQDDDASSTASSEAPMLCSMCGKDEKFGYFVYCTKCKRYGHVHCLQLSTKILAAIRTYRWQCMECKVCVVCNIEKDEENLLFCDRCDRGFHTHCVGLEAIPKGAWTCKPCRPFEDEYQARIMDYKNKKKAKKDGKTGEDKPEKEKKKIGRPKKNVETPKKEKVKKSPKKETTTKSGRKSKAREDEA